MARLLIQFSNNNSTFSLAAAAPHTQVQKRRKIDENVLSNFVVDFWIGNPIIDMIKEAFT